MSLLAKTYGLESSVRFLGERADVSDILNCGDVFALASDSEGLGICMLEALATGVPVVATMTHGATEIIRHGETGFLVPVGDTERLADAVLTLCGSRELRRNMGERGRSIIAQSFCVREMAREYEKLYLRLLRQREGEQVRPAGVLTQNLIPPTKAFPREVSLPC